MSRAVNLQQGRNGGKRYDVDEIEASAEGVTANAALHDSKFNIPAHLKQNSITRHFVANFSGSLSELADSPSLGSWRPTDASIFQSRTRWGPNATKSDERKGNLSQAILIGMKIKKAESTFPCDLGLTITGAKGNFYTGDGKRYAYITGSNEKSHHLDKVVATTNPYINSEYLRLYPGMTKDNLRTNGILEVPGENYVLVDHQHPIVEMMAENAEVLSVDIGAAKLVDDRWYKVAKNVTDRCLKELGDELEGNLPIIDLSDFSVEIGRLHGNAWDSESEVCDNVSSPEMRAKIMDTNRRAQYIIEMSYAFM